LSQVQAELNLAKDLEQVRAVAAGAGWEVNSPDKLTVEISICSSIDGERYWLRFRCTGYPDQPPSIACFDKESGSQQVRNAWPKCQGFRADGPWDLCLPLSAEGFNAHPAWRDDPKMRWNPNGNPLFRVIDELQLLLNDPNKYSGRLR
jgi:hypothetical protein